ncbi:MAG: hypothetical protein COT74_10780 [Bdellovibrionales bacterium CG10_big_fil_rev_8_21_14_0_10_45_34]|nr:MAG: hypothetical protein COT74_10780 [Bdellovibrionales bacterium CG10_big_fil_rev_8_21_14_0_10_45_34]
MLQSVSALRKSSLVGSIIGFLTFGCASGPVTTQIDKSKNLVVTEPTQFQNPNLAIDRLISFNTGSSKDSHIQQIKKTMIKTLLNHKTAVAHELKETGKLLLKSGISYSFNLEAFCVHAGEERPLKGDGLFLGKIQGAAKSWLPVILRDYKKKGISQEDAQILIWSLLSEVRFDQLNSRNQNHLLKLFPDAPVRFGLSVVEDHARNFLLSQLPIELLSAKEQLDKYRGILQDTRSKFSEIEKLLSPVPLRSSPLEVGWLKHEDGYFINLQADGYQSVNVKIYAPEGLKPGTYFEPTEHVALPGEGQRLALSASVIDGYKDHFSQYIKTTIGISTKEALFILKHPLDAVKIYQAAQRALQATWNTFSISFEDNEADAFRHFVWSGIIALEIGAAKAKEFLDAHEDFPENKSDSKNMDLFNNRLGIEYAGKYHGKNFEQDLKKAGLDKIRSGELKWIERKQIN